MELVMLLQLVNKMVCKELFLVDHITNSTKNGTLTLELQSVWLLLYLLVLPMLPICYSLAVALAADAFVIDVVLTGSRSSLTVMTQKNMTSLIQDRPFKSIWSKNIPALNYSPNILKPPFSSNSGHAYCILLDFPLCTLLVSSSSPSFTPFKNVWLPRNTPNPSNSTRIYLYIPTTICTLATSSMLLLVYSCSVTPSYWNQLDHRLTKSYRLPSTNRLFHWVPGYSPTTNLLKGSMELTILFSLASTSASSSLLSWDMLFMTHSWDAWSAAAAKLASMVAWRTPI
jgi:hypothetical protein